MVRRVLIANRGEIALRIIRACRELGVESVAVYSDIDARAPHALAADHAVPIGPAAALQSYLSIPKVIDAARTAGADAVHPGYGFLAENAEFAGACVDAGLVFIGPTGDAIERLGSKIEARRIAAAAGVPTVPGETPTDQSDAGVRAAVDTIGLPALVKASAGGGGKGMRVVTEPTEVDAAIQAARREAHAAFGDGTLYVERLLGRPRHVEVQIFGDRHGNAVHLFERECSVQRRHQKVIEESPSPALTGTLRAAITSAAVAVGRAAEYQNAGTVEFLVDGDAFYFLEMNTRLQVEHPVTEQVIGRDLVRAQLLVASGEPLPWTQADITQRGHAIEARVYAEDPGHEFLPQAGTLLLYREPRLPGVRIDAGVAEGGTVPVHYDPLIAKVIASAECRALARARLIAALRQYPILGVRTNIEFLLRVLDHPRFVDGTIDTAFLDREGGELVERNGAVPPHIRAAALAAGTTPAARVNSETSRQTWDPWHT